MLLKNMLKNTYVPYLLLGFTAACFIKFGNLMPVAVIGIALALIEFRRAKKDRDTENKIKNIEQNGGAGGEQDGI